MRQPVLVALLLALGCGASAQPVKPPPRPHAVAPSVPGSFWDDTAVEEPKMPPLQLEDVLIRPELAERFDALAEEARERLLLGGVLAVQPREEHARTLGQTYVALAKKHVPYVITLDALFSIAFRAVERALDEVDREAVGATLAAALVHTGERLAAESRAARSDTARAYEIALGVVQVARRLLEPVAELAGETTPAVNEELALVLAHAGPAHSALLARTIDYGAFDTQAGLAFDDPRLAQFRALTWLGLAALALAPEPGIDFAMARTQTRAAMLLARTTNDEWARLARAVAFASGRGDDPSAAELLATATKLGFDLRDEATIANVVRVDHLRTALVRAAAPTVEDTGGVLPTFRLLSPAAPPDVRALARLARPNALPTALAVGLALGSPEARAELDTPQEHVAVEEIEHMLLANPSARHASLHASGLDAIATYLAPSAYDAQRPWRETELYQRRKLEVALAAWVTLRHAGVSFARDSARAAIDEAEPTFDDVRGAIEPHPEAIARLVSLVHQTQQGLVVHGLRASGASALLLARVEAFLVDALHIATAQATAQLTPAQSRTLATMPSRLATIERHLGSGSAPLVVVTAADVTLGRVLEDATGEMNEVWLAVDIAGAPSVFVGARIPFHEVTSTLRSTDASWSKRLAQFPPPRAAWVESYSEP